MKKAIAIALILVISFGLVACGGGGKDSIVGKWALEVKDADMEGKMVYEFTKDGKLKISVDTGNEEVDKLMNALYSAIEMTYVAKDGKLTINSNDPAFEPQDSTPYTIEGDTLKFGDISMKRVK